MAQVAVGHPPYLRLFRTVQFQLQLFDIDINYGDDPLTQLVPLSHRPPL